MIVDNVGADQKRKSSPVVSQRRVGAQSSAVSPSIRRLVTPVTLANSCRRWLASAPAAQVTA
jgi:hypothetical protein